MSRLGILFLHGMGGQGTKYSNKMQERLEKRLSDYELRFNTVRYSSTWDDLQADLWEKLVAIDGKIDNGLIRRKAREFAMNSLGDAVTYMEGRLESDSAYINAHAQIRSGLDELRATLADPEAPIAVLAHSLGAKVFSDYLWDAQQSAEGSRRGLWGPTGLNRDPNSFEQGGGVHRLITFGCNIPLFLSGIAEPQAFDVKFMKSGFKWLNYYDRDDLLGWPVGALYKNDHDFIDDIHTQTGGNPISAHTHYWKDSSFTQEVVHALEASLGR